MGLEVITAEVPRLDGCPALNRLKCFVTQLGVVPTLEHVFRDKAGRPLNLKSIFPEDDVSTSGSGHGEVILRCKEIISNADNSNPVIQVPGKVTDARNGVVQFDLTAEMVKLAGIYQLSIAIFDQNSRNVKVDQPILWVERSLFRLDTTDTTFNQGPPTLQDVRQAMIDSSPAENTLLDSVEFTDDQIAGALVKPVRQWNETPPPLRPPLDTRTFPFLEAWIGAIVGHLFMFAAHNYRRNVLQTNAGGINIADKAKEPQYLQAGQLQLQNYTNFVQYKKLEINTALCSGSVGSTYGRRFW